MPLDVVLAASGLEDEFLARAVPTDLDGAVIPIIHLEDLIVAKVLAGRPKDLDDARALWRLHHQELDASRIRTLLAALEEVLDDSKLVPVFDAVTRQA
jgi:predicted nucleotidyltransferase